MTTTTAAITTAAEAATTSAPEPHGGRSRSQGAAAALSERLYARHHSLVLGLCRGLLRDRVEAEDAAQQAFLSAHRALLNGAEPREPAAWLATIARNECWARTSARMREPLPSDAMDEVATSDDPVQEAIRHADLHALWLAIKQLPRQQRDALLLREFGGLRYDELAVALAVSEPSVESLLFRARTRLRMQLKAAYAAVSGASWLESLARLLAGGGAPAVATKAVALTLGAAAVSSSAVVVPKVFENHASAPAHVRPRAHVVHHVAVVKPAVEAAVTPPLAVVVTTTPHRPVAVAPRTRSHEDGSRSHEGERAATPVTTREQERAPSSRGDDSVTTAVSTVALPTEQGGGHDGRDGGDGGDDGSSGTDGSDH